VRDANESEDEVDPSHRPLNTELVWDYHKQHHIVLFQYLLNVYNNIKPLLQPLPNDKKAARDIIRRHGFQERKDYERAARKAQSAGADDMQLISNYQNMLIDYNKKQGLPPDLGQIPRVRMYEIWRDYKSGKYTDDQATRKLRSLWAQTQFPLGFTKLAPVLKGKYPTKEDMEQEYRERTNCDPMTGEPLGKGKGKATKIGKEKPSKDKGKAKAKFTVEPGGPSNFQEDVDMPDAPPLGGSSSGPSSSESSSSESSSSESSSSESSSRRRSHKKTKRSHKKTKRSHKSKGGYGGSSSAVLRRRHGDGDSFSPAIVLRSHRSSSNYLRPGFTASNERIVAYKTTTRKYHGDDGRNVAVTTRRYVVKKDRHTYTLEWESSCGGPKVWYLLPDNIPEINADLETMPGRNIFERGQYGIDWVAPGVMPRGGDLPAKLPDMVCKFWWMAGRHRHTRILFRSNLIELAGKPWTDQEFIRVLCPPDVFPKPATLWELLKLFYPHVRPLVLSEQRRRLGPPPSQPLLLPAPRRSRAIENSVTGSDSEVDNTVNRLRGLSFNSDSSSETDTTSRKRSAKLRSKQKHQHRSRRKEILYETATSGTETDSDVGHRRHRRDHHMRAHSAGAEKRRKQQSSKQEYSRRRSGERVRGKRKNVRFQVDSESEEQPIRKDRGAKHKGRDSRPSSESEQEEPYSKRKDRGAKYKGRDSRSSSESEQEEPYSKRKDRGAKHKGRDSRSSSESGSEGRSKSSRRSRTPSERRWRSTD